MHNIPSFSYPPPLSSLGAGPAGSREGGVGSLSSVRVRRTLDGREPDRVPVLNIRSAEHAPISATDVPQTTPESDFALFTVDLTPRYPVQILDQDGETVVQTTPHGGVCRFSLLRGGPPEILDYPVKSRTDWKLLARRLEAEPDRVDWTALQPAAKRAGATGLCAALAAPAGFRVCAAYLGAAAADMVGADPGLIRDIADTHAGLLAGMAELILAGGQAIDVLLLFDDLADRRGLLFSPARYRQAFAPALCRLTGFARDHGIKVLYCAGGDLRLLVPDLLDTGLDCLGPLDVAAGMDLPTLKINYGADLAFLGGIDRRALHNPDPAVLEREISCKVRAGMVNGRYIAGFDGPLPDNLPPEQLARAAALLAQYGKY
jgi:uroporphyrinogen decarboxylase